MNGVTFFSKAIENYGTFEVRKNYQFHEKDTYINYCSIFALLLH